MKTKLLATVATLSLMALPAMATDWTIFNGSSRQCEKAPALLASPLIAEKMLRAAGIYEDTQVTRASDGSILTVQVKDTNSSGGLMYFSDMAFCQKILKAAKDAGKMPTPDELK